MQAPPELPRGARDRDYGEKIRARENLQGELVGYWLSIISSEGTWNAAKASDLLPVFCTFARARFESLAREYAPFYQSAPDYHRFLKYVLAGRVVDEIRPLKVLKALEQESPKARLPSPDGEWEAAVQESWTTARFRMGGQRPFQEIERHPFQAVLRRPVRGNSITTAIMDAVRQAVPEVLQAMSNFLTAGAILTPATHARTIEADARAVETITARIKPGPKRDLETARKVANLVSTLAPGQRWQDKLDEILEGLDEAQIPRPKGWPNRDHPLRSWSDATVGSDRELAKKAIAHHLENAKVVTLS